MRSARRPAGCVSSGASSLGAFSWRRRCAIAAAAAQIRRTGRSNIIWSPWFPRSDAGRSVSGEAFADVRICETPTDSFACAQEGGPAYTRSEAGGGQVARQSGQAGNRAALTSFSLGRSPVSTPMPGLACESHLSARPLSRRLRAPALSFLPARDPGEAGPARDDYRPHRVSSARGPGRSWVTRLPPQHRLSGRAVNL